MGFIELPSNVPTVFCEIFEGGLDRGWLTKEDFEKETFAKYPYFKDAFKKFQKDDMKFFLGFYTTNLSLRKDSGFVSNDEQLMMVVCQYGKIQDIGLYIEVKTLYRYGLALSEIKTYNDFITEIETYFPEGLGHIDDALKNNIPYTYLGWSKDYEDLLSDLVYSFHKGAKR